MMLILRREQGEIVRYAHLGTGNYHAGNARLYTDYSLLTSLETRYVDEQATDLDDALARIAKYTAEGKAISIALHGNAAEILPELVKRGVRPDMVTDQTSAHDPLNGYLPAGWTWEQYRDRAQTEPAAVVKAAKQSMAVHVQAMLDFQKQGVPTSTTATTSARWPRKRA